MFQSISAFGCRKTVTDLSRAALAARLGGDVRLARLGPTVHRQAADPAAASAPVVVTLVDVTGIVIDFTVAKAILSGTIRNDPHPSDRERGLPRGGAEGAGQARPFRFSLSTRPPPKPTAKSSRRSAGRRKDFDRLIGAHALATGCTLVTANAPDFSDIPGLSLDNWTLSG